MKRVLFQTLRLLLSLVMFGAGLAGASMAIGRVLPPLQVPGVAAKLKWFREHANEYDTVLFGSSRVYHQIDPHLFDQLMAERGRPTRTFNAGIDGMRPAELNFFVDEILRCRPKNLRLVLIESGAIRVPLDPDKRGTLRAIYWHDFERLRLVMRAALALRKPPAPGKWNVDRWLESYEQPWVQLLDHGDLFVRNFLNFGRSEHLAHWLQWPRPPVFVDNAAFSLGPRWDGFRSMGPENRIALDELAKMNKELMELRSEGWKTYYGDSESQRAFDGMLRRLEAAGARTVQFIPPTTGTRKFHLRKELERGRMLIDFTPDYAQLWYGLPQAGGLALAAVDPRLAVAAAPRFAALPVSRLEPLFLARYRVDADHLNLAGAEMLTRMVVEDLWPQLSRKP